MSNPSRLSAAVHTDFLRRDRDVCVAGAKDLAMRHHPHGRRVDAAADIEPFDQHGAVEPGRSVGVSTTIRVV